MAYSVRSPSSQTVREAGASDAALLRHLYQSLVPGNPRVAVDGERVEQVRRDPNNFLLIAEENGQVHGTLLLTLCLDSMFVARPFGVLENFVVHESARRRGVGTLLLEHAERIARENFATKLMLLSGAQRVQAHQLFGNLGFDSTVARAFKKYL